MRIQPFLGHRPLAYKKNGFLWVFKIEQCRITLPSSGAHSRLITQCILATHRSTRDLLDPLSQASAAIE